jgi:putative flippase GtrA
MGTESSTSSRDRENSTLLPAKNGPGSFLTSQQERTRFFRFLFVGAFGAVVDFGIFNLLIQLFNILPVIASTISFISAIISNFLWNRYWTYPDSRSKPIRAQMAQFGLISGLGLIIRVPLFAFLEPRMISLAAQLIASSFPLTPTFLGHNSALAISVLVVMMWNFFANRFWTYNDVK